MKACATRDELFRDPVGRWMSFGNGLFWCHSPTLCGVAVWGRPGPADVDAALRIFDGYHHLAPQFDMVQDAGAVEAIDPDAMALLLDWLTRHREMVGERIRNRAALIPAGMSGLALAGIKPVLDLPSDVTIVSSPREAFELLLPDGGAALSEQVQRLVDQVRGLPPVLVELRALLLETSGAIDLAGAARSLGVSPRSLQRQLAGAGSSFRAEQADARYRAAEELLCGDDKLAAVAARLGLSEDGLTDLVRARSGLTPGELRRRLHDGRSSAGG